MPSIFEAQSAQSLNISIDETSQQDVATASAAEEAEVTGADTDNPAQQQQSSPTQQDSNSLLDALMLQVEAESATASKSHPVPRDVTEGTERTEHTKELETSRNDHPDPETNLEGIQEEPPVGATDNIMDLTDGTVNGDLNGHGARQDEVAALVSDTNGVVPTGGDPSDTAAQLPANVAIPSAAEEAEWEIDSSPYESSSDSDSSSDTTSSDDNSDEDADGDYAMLEPEEAARILMQGDGGDDEEGGRSRDKADDAPLRTTNERFEEVIPKPDIVVTEEMKVEELGNVEFVVENTVLIKAKTSGEYQVLEPGSLICLKDRSVVGVVADLIGRVEEPRYTIRFTNAQDIEEAGLSATGTTVYYVPEHSTFVFTQPLKAVKGSDASNFHDEEVAEDEMEFSDDEAEAEHKRQMKARRQGRPLETGRGRGGFKAGRGAHRGGRGASQGHISHRDGVAYGNGSLEMNYDDVPEGGDDGYTPLQRPANLTEMMAQGEQSQERPMVHPLPPPPTPFHGGRGRGHARGGGGGGRGGFRPNRGGGGYNQPQGPGFHNQQQAGGSDPRSGFSQHNQHNRPAVPVPNLHLPPTPSITPYNMTYPPMTPSPMTPLANVPFNFGFQPPPGFSFMPAPGVPPPPFQPQPQPQQHNYQYPYQQPQPNGLQGQQPQQAQSPPNFSYGPWANNPAIAAALQKQAEEQRKSQGL